MGRNRRGWGHKGFVVPSVNVNVSWKLRFPLVAITPELPLDISLVVGGQAGPGLRGVRAS